MSKYIIFISQNFKLLFSVYMYVCVCVCAREGTNNTRVSRLDIAFKRKLTRSVAREYRDLIGLIDSFMRARILPFERNEQSRRRLSYGGAAESNKAARK